MNNKVLYVEYRRELAYFVEKILSSKGCLVDWTDAANIAWQYLIRQHDNAEPYFLAIIDLDQIRKGPYGELFRKEGLRLIRRIRRSRKFKNLKIISTMVHIAKNRNTWENASIKAGANKFIEFPIEADEFEDEIDLFKKIISQSE